MAVECLLPQVLRPPVPGLKPTPGAGVPNEGPRVRSELPALARQHKRSFPHCQGGLPGRFEAGFPSRFAVDERAIGGTEVMIETSPWLTNIWQ